MSIDASGLNSKKSGFIQPITASVTHEPSSKLASVVYSRYNESVQPSTISVRQEPSSKL